MPSPTQNVLGAACVGGVGAALLLPARTALAREVEVPLKDLPREVLDGAAKAVPKAKWLQATKDEDDGETTYEVAGYIPGKKNRLVTVELDADGEVVEVETEIDVEAVPSVVMSAFREKYARVKIEAVFEVRAEGELKEYEFSCTRPRKAPAKGKGKGKGKQKPEENITVIVSPDGKKVGLEEDDE